MNTTEFLALCESDPAEANRMVALTSGLKPHLILAYGLQHTKGCKKAGTTQWGNVPKNSRWPTVSREHFSRLWMPTGRCKQMVKCLCGKIHPGLSLPAHRSTPNFVGSLDAAWTLEDWVEPHADGIFILAKRHGINPAKPRNAAALFCADWLQARGKLEPEARR